MLFWSLIVLGLVLTFLELRFHYLPLALAASIIWLTVFFYILTGEYSEISTSTSTGLILCLGIFLMVIVPIAHFISRMGKTQVTYTENGRAYTMWSQTPKDTRSRSQISKEARRAEIRKVVDRSVERRQRSNIYRRS